MLNSWVLYYTERRPPSESIRLKQLLLHPAIKPDSLLAFARFHKENDNASFIPENPNAPVEAIDLCARSSNTLVQLAAVESKRLSRERSEEVLWDMVKKEKHAHNPRVFDSSMTTAAMLDEFLELRSDRGGMVVHHPSISSQQLAKLSQHSFGWTRQRVAEHPKTPKETLEILTNDPLPEVAEAAKFNLAERRN